MVITLHVEPAELRRLMVNTKTAEALRFWLAHCPEQWLSTDDLATFVGKKRQTVLSTLLELRRVGVVRRQLTDTEYWQSATRTDFGA